MAILVCCIFGYIPRGLKHGQIVRQHLPQQQQQQHQKHPDIIKMTTIPARVSKGNKSPNGALQKWAWVHEIVSSSSFIDKVCRLRLGHYDQYLWLGLDRNTAEPNRPNNWFWQFCHSTPYIFHDQTRYFKLEIWKNPVQIDRGVDLSYISCKCINIEFSSNLSLQTLLVGTSCFCVQP